MLSTHFFALILLPASVYGHGCPAFALDSEEARDEVLGIETDFFPQAIKDIIEESPDEVFTGNYDCHKLAGDFEVGVAFICDEDEECSCTALYQFQECSSCEVCGEGGDVNSFSADCSNVEGFTNECTIECGYMTEGCFDPAEMIIDPSANTTDVEEGTDEEETPAVTMTNETVTETTDAPTTVAPTTTPVEETSTSSAPRVVLGAIAAVVAVASFA